MSPLKLTSGGIVLYGGIDEIQYSLGGEDAK
jgi:hypothetical protein